MRQCVVTSSQSQNTERVNHQALLRLLHSFKGNAAAFGYESLTKYVHAFESFVHQSQKNSSAHASAIGSLVLSLIEGLETALVVYRAGGETDMNFSPLLREMALYLRNNKAKANTLAAAPHLASQDSSAALEQEPAPVHLMARVHQTRFAIPHHAVVEAIYRPDIIPVTGSFLSILESSGNIRHAKLVRFRGHLMPLLSPVALLEQVNESGSDVAKYGSSFSIPWALIIRDPQGVHHKSKLNQVWFCLPVDEIFGIIDLKQAQQEHGVVRIDFKNIHDALVRLQKTELAA